MAAGRWLLAVTMLLGLMACSDPEPTTMDPSATASTDPSDSSTPSSSPPTSRPPELVMANTCTVMFDPKHSPSLELVDYLLQTRVSAKDNAKARGLLGKVRSLARKTPKPLGERIDQLADAIAKIIRTRRTPGLTTPYDPAPIQRLGNKISSLCRDYV